jgi:DinB family protein
MTDTQAPTDFRGALVDTLRAARATERNVFGAFEAADRDTPPADGEWSPKDIQAHLGAWRRHMTERLAAIREDRPEAEDGGETDATNAVIHDERADWPWDRVLADAESSADDLIAEVEAAEDSTLAVDRTVGSIMGNGAEHTIIHVGSVADRVGLGSAVAELSGQIETIVDRGGWPQRSAAFARYNLACFHALAGRLDEARALLRMALPIEQDLRDFAAEDSDLVALRDELQELAKG